MLKPGLPKSPDGDWPKRHATMPRSGCAESAAGLRRRHSHGHRHGYGCSHRHGKEAGYTLVMFVVTIAIMSIMMGVAVQTAEFQMQREREAELIFRGEQFIEAIRLYKVKYGRYPMQLKEIYEAKPRVVRKKWKDPITDSENWGIIFLGQEGRQPGQQGRQLVGPGAGGTGLGSGGRNPIGTQTPFGNQRQGRGNQQGERDSFGNVSNKNPGGTGSQQGEGGFGQVGADRKMGPIVGVHSISCDEAIKIYEGRTTYCEWRFIYREQKQQGGRAGGQRPPQQQPGQPPVGWHPGDKLDTDEDGNPVKVPPGGGNQPPRPIRTPSRP